MEDRILIVGLGSIGKRHLGLIREALPKADIRIYRHSEYGELPEFANGFCGSFDAIRNFSPDLSVVCNPAPFHLKISEFLVSLGCAVLIEKPLSHNLEGVLEFKEKVKNSKAVCQIAYNFRFSPSLGHFRSLYADGIVGHALTVAADVGHFLPNWRPAADYTKTVSAQKSLGGGVLLELSHEIDYLNWIFGDVQWVSGWLGKLSGLEVDVEDTAKLTFETHSGYEEKRTICSLTMDFIRQNQSRTCQIFGTKGSLRWDGIAGTVEVFLPEVGHWQHIFVQTSGYNESYKQQWDSFYSSYQKKESPVVTVSDGEKVLQIIEAARKSADQYGQVVYV